jgi:hypothetical protein
MADLIVAVLFFGPTFFLIGRDNRRRHGSVWKG